MGSRRVDPKMEVAALGEVSRPDELDVLDTIKREPMEVWGGKTIWVWGLSFQQFMALMGEAQRPDGEGRMRFDGERYAICRVIECARDSGERDAKPLFSRDKHYDWLRRQDAGTIDAIVRRSMELSGEAEGMLDPDPTTAGP
jgi:hypothetical protein